MMHKHERRHASVLDSARSALLPALLCLAALALSVSPLPARANELGRLLEEGERIDARIDTVERDRHEALITYFSEAVQNIDPEYREKFVRKARAELPGDRQNYRAELQRRQAALDRKLSAAAGEYQPLVRNFETGEIKEKELIVQRDRKIEEAHRKIKDRKQRLQEVRRIQDAYAARSRQLVAQYRQPLIDKVIADVNAGLPEGKRIRQTLGQGLYKTDAAGKRILNPNHRGWSGDIDFGGSEVAAKRLERLLKAAGMAPENYPGYLDAKRLEITVNKTGAADVPGGEFHEMQARVDALSKETYVSCSMGSEQAGRSYVEVNDHYKKASGGLREPPEKLFQRKDKLQGMAKGALKAGFGGKTKPGAAQPEAAEHARKLEAALKRAGFDGTADDFKRQLEIIKTSPRVADVMFDSDEMAVFQKACRETLELALDEAGQRAQKEMRELQGEISRADNEAAGLEKKAAEAKSRGDARDAGELDRRAKERKARAAELRKQQMDSRVKMKAADAARREIMTGEPIHVKEKVTPLESGRKPAKGAPGLVGAKTYMKFLDLKGWTEDFIKGVDQAVAEEREGDGSLKTWGKSVGYVLAESTGIPSIYELYRAEVVEADRRIKEEIDQIDFSRLDEEARNELIKQITVVETFTAAYRMGKKLGMGMAEGLAGAPVQAGAMLGELYAKKDLEDSEAASTAMNARLIQYNAGKMKRLQALMDDIRLNGFDDAKALERDTLVRYFYAFREKHQADRELSVFAERWVQAIESHQTPGIGAMTAAVGHFLAQGGSPLVPSKSPVKAGEILAFEVPRIGGWSGKHEVQWLVNGENYKTAPGSDPKAHMLRFDSTGMAPGTYNVAVRLIDTAGKVRKIVAHQGISLRLVKHILTMESFNIRAALRDYDGPALPPSVQNGDILAFQADLKHPGGEAQPAQLVWQVYDRAGNPVQGLSKQEQLLEAGTTKNHRFKIQLDDLDEGDYSVRLTHFFTESPEEKKQAEARFRVSQAVRIERVLVTDNPGDQTHKPVLSPDQEPLLYAHYKLSPDVGKATITLTAKDASGRVIETVAVERPRPGEKPPYRVGLSVPNAKVPIGAEILFEAEITADGGKRHAARTSFRKEAYRLVLNVPGALRSGENKPFSIAVPKSFRGPFTVDVRAAGRGLSVGHTPGSLSGTVGGIASGTAEIGNLTVSVTDADGKKAAAQARVEIQPEEERLSADPGKAPRPSSPAYRQPASPPLVPAKPGYAPPSFAGIEQSPSVRQQQPAPAPDSVDAAAGRKKWTQVVDHILGKTIHPCYRSTAPQAFEKVRRQMLDLKSVDFAALAKMDAGQLARFRSEQEKLFAQEALYNTIMRSGLSGDCPGKMVELLAFQGLISSAQAAAYREKTKPKTIYWVVITSTLSRNGKGTTARAHVTTGNQPPVTGFSQPNPAAAGHYYVVMKAYGTLDPREAEQIAQNINQGKYQGGFSRTRYSEWGHIGKGLEGVPLVTYGPGVKALAGPAQATRATAESAGKSSSAFRGEAVKRLKTLAPNLEAEFRKMAGDISVLQHSIDNSKKALARDLAELKRIAAPLGAKARTMTREQFMARHGAEFQRGVQMESRYNEKTKEHNRLVEKRNGLIKRQKEIAALHDAVAAEWRKGDIERCIEIANGSPLAKEFGYKPLYK